MILDEWLATRKLSTNGLMGVDLVHAADIFHQILVKS